MIKTKRIGLRRGYTTGACAAAAAKAACLSFFKQKKIDKIKINLPRGEEVAFLINKSIYNKSSAQTVVIKDAGDDPDITHGTKIVAVFKPAEKARRNNQKIIIKGGKGVGIVTKPGLPVKPGKPAINPVPQKMILEAVQSVLIANKTNHSPYEIIISVPDGEKLARRTMNPRLGIMGGISILGTTGIVEPMSVKAYQSVIKTSIDIAHAAGCKELVFSPGRNSEIEARKLFALPEESFIITGDYIGHALKTAHKKGIGGINLVGRLGKFSKLSQGHFMTHVRNSKIDFNLMAQMAKEWKMDTQTIDHIKTANTMAEVVNKIRQKDKYIFFEKICCRIIKEIRKYLIDKNSRCKLRCLLISEKNEVLADVT